MISVERNSSKIFRLRLNSLRNCSHSGAHRHRNGLQLKRSIYRTQRFLLLSKTTGPMVPPRNRSALNYKKFGLPQAPPVHIPDHDLYFSIVGCGDVSRVQQKGGGSPSVVGVSGVIVPTVRAGKIYSGAIYRKVLSKTGRQVKKFCLRLFTQSNCFGFLFHTNLFSARFWNCNGYFSGHLHNAFYRWAQEKISVSFNSSNNSHCSISNFICRIPNQKNHRLSQSMGRSFWSRFSGHSIFLRFWKGRFLGRWFGRKFSETLSSSRSTHGFYFFSDWGRAGLCGHHSNRSLILNFYLERIFDGLPSQRSFWNSFSNRIDPPNWVAGFYKLGRRFRPSPYKGVDLTFYKHGRIVDACDNAFCRRNTEYFRANCKTLTMN